MTKNDMLVSMWIRTEDENLKYVLNEMIKLNEDDNFYKEEYIKGMYMMFDVMNGLLK